MKVVAIIQARTGSTRLPGKVLLDIAGRPMLAHVVERTARARLVDTVVVATTSRPSDDAIVHECSKLGVPAVRGDEQDVLERYVQAAMAFRADLVVRITSDCPLTDSALVDAHVARAAASRHEFDFVTNMIEQSYPLGLAVEVLPIDVLHRMDRMSTTAYLREHVTTLAYERPALFSIDHVRHTEDFSRIRWTVDTREDLERVRRIFGAFGDNRFTWQDAMAMIDCRDGTPGS